MKPKEKFYEYVSKLSLYYDEVIMVNRRNPFTEVGRRSSVSGIAHELLDNLSEHISVVSFSVEEIYDHPSINPRRGFEEYNLNTGVKFLHESTPIVNKFEIVEQYKQTIQRLCMDVNSHLEKSHYLKKALYIANDFQMIDTINYISEKHREKLFKCFILHEPFNYSQKYEESVRFAQQISQYDFVVLQDDLSDKKLRRIHPQIQSVVTPAVPPEKLFYSSVDKCNPKNLNREIILDSLSEIININSAVDGVHSYQPISTKTRRCALQDNAIWVVGSMDRISEPKYLPERIIAFKLFIQKKLNKLIANPVLVFLGNVRSIEGNQAHDLEFKTFKSWIQQVNLLFEDTLGYSPLIDLGKVDEPRKFSLMAMTDIGIYTWSNISPP